MLEGRAAILRDSFVGDEHGEDFRLAEGDLWELVHFLGVIVAIALAVEFDGQHQPIAHEVHIAHNGAQGALKLFGQLGAVGKRFLVYEVVEAHHPLPRWTIQCLRLDFSHNFFSVISLFYGPYDTQCQTPSCQKPPQKDFTLCRHLSYPPNNMVDMNTILLVTAIAQLLLLIAALVLIFTQRGQLAQQLLQGQREGEDRSRIDLLNAQAAFLGTIQNTIRDAGSQQADQLRLFSEQLNRTTQMVDAKLGELRIANDAKLEEMRRTVDEKLQGTLEKRLGESFKQVSERLEAVFKGLGEMQNLARGVGDLSKVLTNVKTRGTWGEVQLGNLLEQILTPEQFGRNVAVNPNENARVEFAIKLPGQADERPVWLPIDAKFPLEDYQRLVEFAEKADVAGVEAASKALENRVLDQASDIAAKYIHPPYSTDFGVLFLPTEGLYAEVLRRPGLAEKLQRDYRVVVAGPTTIAALLNSLQVGFRTLAIQQRSAEVWEVLGAVKTEFGKFSGVLGSVRKKLEAASKEIDETGVRTRAIERKLRDVEAMPAAEAAALIPDLAGQENT